jgi:hypothetical protein
MIDIELVEIWRIGAVVVDVFYKIIVDIRVAASRVRSARRSDHRADRSECDAVVRPTDDIVYVDIVLPDRLRGILKVVAPRRRFKVVVAYLAPVVVLDLAVVIEIEVADVSVAVVVVISLIRVRDSNAIVASIANVILRNYTGACTFDDIALPLRG